MRAWLVVAVLATLAACAERGVTPSRGNVADSADQVIQGMETQVTKGGVLLSTVQADSAWVYNARQVTDLKRVTMIFYDNRGQVSSTVTADSGTYQMRDGTLEARGHVVAVTPAPDSKTLNTEHLVFDKTARLIRSDTAYTFTSASGNGSGASFETDPDFKRIRSWQPKGRQRGTGFLLPGQDTTGGGR
jgi:LPS export ABC transporter protein LptC